MSNSNFKIYAFATQNAMSPGTISELYGGLGLLEHFGGDTSNNNVGNYLVSNGIYNDFLVSSGIGSQYVVPADGTITNLTINTDNQSNNNNTFFTIFLTRGGTTSPLFTTLYGLFNTSSGVKYLSTAYKVYTGDILEVRFSGDNVGYSMFSLYIE